MKLQLTELFFRLSYSLFSIFCSCCVFLVYSSIWLEFLIVRFNSYVSGVFFCLSALVRSRMNVSLFLSLAFGIPFALFQIGLYFIPSLYLEERINFLFVCFGVIFNSFFSFRVWWLYVLPFFFISFVDWFGRSGLAITYIPEVTALIRLILVILIRFIFIFQLPSFIFIGIVLGFWDFLFLRANRIGFYLVFLIFRTFVSPPEFWFQFSLVFLFILGFEITLFISSFFFISKIF
jgi:sec-independent protein translocase protein TatC